LREILIDGKQAVETVRAADQLAGMTYREDRA
jgi:hypothetical protein